MTLSTRQPGYRLPLGEWFNDIISVVNGLTGGSGAASSATSTTGVSTVTGTSIMTPQAIAAAGSTQGGATLITKSMVMVSVTASSQGVRLPSAATGLMVTVCAASAKGVKVYPSTGDRIFGGATNAGVALALNKANLYVAQDATVWRVLRGA